MEHLRYHLTVRLYRQDKSFGPGPMRLLRGVEEGGSLHQAAEAMGMSYSKAWTLLRKLEKEWGFTLLDRQSAAPKEEAPYLPRKAGICWSGMRPCAPK